MRVFGISKQILNLFRMSPFGVVYSRGGEGKKAPPPHNLSHIIQWGNLAQLYFTWRRSKKWEVIITLILEGIDQNKQYFEGCFWFKFNNLGLALDMVLKFNTNVVKGSKLKVRRFWELIPILVEVIREKLVRGFSTLQTWLVTLWIC